MSLIAAWADHALEWEGYDSVAQKLGIGAMEIMRERRRFAFRNSPMNDRRMYRRGASFSGPSSW